MSTAITNANFCTTRLRVRAVQDAYLVGMATVWHSSKEMLVDAEGSDEVAAAAKALQHTTHDYCHRGQSRHQKAALLRTMSPDCGHSYNTALLF